MRPVLNTAKALSPRTSAVVLAVSMLQCILSPTTAQGSTFASAEVISMERRCFLLLGMRSIADAFSVVHVTVVSVCC